MPALVRTHPWHDRRHHRAGGGFQNPWPAADAPDPSPLQAARWIAGHLLGTKEQTPPRVRPVLPLALDAPPAGLRVTWLGHAAVFVQTPALNLLTDPMFADRASPFGFAGPKREIPRPLPLDALPRVDVVLCSHDHFDHLDPASIRTLVRTFDPLFLAPLGVDALLRRWGATRVFGFDWHQYADLGGRRFHCVPAKHFSGRGLHNRDGTLWAGWYVEADGFRLYFAGDSAYAPLFADVRARHGVPDLALLPIGAYEPRWFMARVHVTPEEAARAAADLDARHVVPIHWGTFDLSDEPFDEPPRLFREAMTATGLADRLHLLDPGEMLPLG